MFVALWEYEVKPGSEERFENAYGPGGGWAKLFRSDPNYARLAFYVMPIVLRFTSLSISGIPRSLRTVHGHPQRQVQMLDAAGEELASKERRIGWYELVAP